MQRRCLRLGDVLSDDGLAAKILAFIDTYKTPPRSPYRWTYTGDRWLPEVGHE